LVNLILWSLLGLAVQGGAVSLFFTLVYYGRIDSREVPAALCRAGERTCLSIVRTPHARLFGLPNSLFGLAFYALTALVAGLALAGMLPGWLWRVNLLAAIITVALIPYLVWALVAKLKTWCRL
jgi:uncharacterized membrane protein